jgi:hypothetical protein
LFEQHKHDLVITITITHTIAIITAAPQPPLPVTSPNTSAAFAVSSCNPVDTRSSLAWAAADARA